ncbi:MAG TPA: F0F1 ATP synthase subunit delta [Leptolyngbyaceae cyanobacterium M33_DOE_097]|uniref:ATP synthase subunit delta n=1 Tax=Oscillatoriales cyanobacterium SpSt-418 TaxID=2282169 RepID=A0A7C3PG55_9CYAN|nr:F0F1 ATP synthase subunit delta [Leptolyngbyaceae cyanobacterium M33_DOE_097]
MKGSVVATEVFEPYAQALMSLAQSQGLEDRFGEDASALIQILRESDELNQVLSSPLFEAGKKKAILQQILGDQFHPYMKNFLMLLVDRRRITYLQGILKQYQSLLRNLRRTVLAEVISAVPLTDEQQHAVREKVIAMTGAQQVELDPQINPDLIGGVIIKVGSQVVDASLRGQLRRISLRLAGTSN